MAAPVLELIRAALNVTNDLFPGEDPDANAARSALFNLNSMLDSWSAEKLVAYTERNDTFTLTPGVATYSIGPTGAFVMPRPIAVNGAQAKVPGGTDTVLKVLSNDDYNGIEDKAATSEAPTEIGFLPTFPSASISFWPVPTTAAVVRISTSAPFTQLSTMTEIVTLPPGYQEAIIYNLAVRICTSTHKAVPGSVAQMAADSLARIKANNVPESLLQFPPEVLW